MHFFGYPINLRMPWIVDDVQHPSLAITAFRCSVLGCSKVFDNCHAGGSDTDGGGGKQNCPPPTNPRTRRNPRATRKSLSRRPRRSWKPLRSNQLIQPRQAAAKPTTSAR